MLRRDLEQPGEMVLAQLPQIFLALHGQVVADAAPDEDFFDAGDARAPSA